MALTKEQFDRLPKYAQDEVTRLRREVEDAERIRDDVLALTPTKVCINRSLSHGVDAVQYIEQASGVNFELGHVDGVKRPSIVTVRSYGDRLEVMGTGYPSGLSVEPKSSNLIVVRAV